MGALFLIMASGIWRSSLFRYDLELYAPGISLWKLVLCILLLLIFINLVKNSRLSYAVRRSTSMLISVLLVVAIAIIFDEDKNYFRYALAGYYIIGALCQVGPLIGTNVGTEIVKDLYFFHDLLLGHVIFFFLFLLSATQVFKSIQTWLLFHNALSTDVVVSDI